MDNDVEQRQMRTLTIITSDAYEEEKAFYRVSSSFIIDGALRRTALELNSRY